jgi:hypothetical protein
VRIMWALAFVLGVPTAALFLFTLGVAAGAWGVPGWLMTTAGVFTYLLIAVTPVVFGFIVWGRLYLALMRYLERGHRGTGTP